MRLLKMASGLFIYAHLLAYFWTLIEPSAATEDWVTNYNKAIYWVITSLTTIGYGDIVPTTNTSRVFTIFVEVSGVAIYSVVFAQVARTFVASDRKQEAISNKIADLGSLLKHYNVPVSLQKDSLHYYTHLIETRLLNTEEALLSELPASLAHEIRCYMLIKPLSSIPLFHHCSVECLKDVAVLLEERSVAPNEVLFNQGDAASEMFLIGHGEVQIIRDNLLLATLKKGNCFGESALLESRPRSATAKAMSYTTLYVLAEKRFHEVLQRHEDLRIQMEKVHRARTARTL